MSIENSLNPLTNRLIIRPDKLPEVTEGGIILPETVIERPQTGKVLAIGPDVLTIENGDKVVYPPYSGMPLEYGDEELVVLRESDILATVEGES